jgi:predicted dehydrogenase
MVSMSAEFSEFSAYHATQPPDLTGAAGQRPVLDLRQFAHIISETPKVENSNWRRSTGSERLEQRIQAFKEDTVSNSFASFDWPAYRPPLEKYKLNYRIGIIGYGGIVRAQHVTAYRLAGYQVTAAADVSAQRVELAKRDGIPTVFEDYRQLLQRDDVDIIDCAVAHWGGGMESRVAILKDAVKAGKPILMQKPMAVDLKTAEEMVKTAEDAGVPFAINQNMRFDPAIYLTKQFLVPERFGQPACVVFNNFSFEGPKFGVNSEGGVLGWLIHGIDTARWLSGGDPVSVYGTNKNFAALYHMEFSNGALCDYMEYHNADNFHNETPVKVWAEKGAVRANHRWNPGSRWEKDQVEVRGYDWPKAVGWVSCALPDDATNADLFIKPTFDQCSSIAGFIGSMGEFMQSLHEKRPAMTNARDNLMSLRIAFAGELSAKLKRPVDPRTMQPV